MGLRERQAEFGRWFIAAGYPLVSAAAIVGNATQENMCLPTTTGPKDHGSDGALQWRAERLVELQAVPNWDTLKAQAAFTIHELKRDYKALEADLRAGTKSLATLTANFVDVFERPSIEGRVLDTRIKYAGDAMGILQSARPQIPAQPPIPQPPTIGVPTMLPIDPAIATALEQIFVPIIESLLSGLVKGFMQHISTITAPQSTTTPTTGVPGLDPAAIAQLIAKELASITGVKQ
jgi:hypothetical protein